MLRSVLWVELYPEKVDFIWRDLKWSPPAGDFEILRDLEEGGCESSLTLELTPSAPTTRSASRVIIEFSPADEILVQERM